MLDRSTGQTRDGRPRSSGFDKTGASSPEDSSVSKLDPLLMRADIARVGAERPDLDHTIVRGLYEHFLDVQGRQPDLDEFRDYVDRITSSIEWLDLRELLDPHEPTVEERAAYEEAAFHSDRVVNAVTVAPGPRRPGRPGWTADLFWARYGDACARADPPCTYRSVARHFESLDGGRGIDPDHLRKLARRFGPPPG
jgi:hypothetical protein